jgi:hypothetical protein
VIALTTTQFLCVLGLSGAQLVTLFGIFLRLGRLIIADADKEARLKTLEGKSHVGVSVAAGA